jgi:SMI1-KNR4 cell-wall
MNPGEYLNHLERSAERMHLASSDLRPASDVDITSVEREVGLSLPEDYVDFICRVGTGKEHGGTAEWFHVDITRPGNIIDHSHSIMKQQIKRLRDSGTPVSRYPKGMLVIYDACDGFLYGFVPNTGSTYKPGVYSWDCDDMQLDKVADTFEEFLDFLSEAEGILL